jgi:hypothetical protein
MKKLLYVMGVVLVIACNNKPAEEAVAAPQQPVKVEKFDPLELHVNKSHIDSLFKYATKDEITIFVKQSGKEELIKVEAKHLPGDIEISYNIFRDNMGHIIRISESPASESGDWFISCNHYFDDKGKTFAFEKKTNSFNSRCTEGVLYETKTEYFDGKFTKLDFTYKLVDDSDRHMMKDSCDIFEYEYQPQRDLVTYLLNKSIPLNP